VRPEHLAPLGAALARLHAAGQGFPVHRPNALGPKGWAPLLEGCRARGDEAAPGLVAELDGHLAAILAAWPDEGTLPDGHIHADLFPDNVFFLPDAAGRPAVSGLIDFYFACTDLLAYDIAVCLNAWCFEPDGSFNVTKARALLGAYEGVRRLTAAERAALPVLCRGAAIRFLLTRLYDWTHTPPGALVTRKDPLEYLRKLRFFARAETAEAIGG
jgi:homoserine kinase type II